MIHYAMLIIAAVVGFVVGHIVGAYSCDKRLQMKIIECATLAKRCDELREQLNAARKPAPRAKRVSPSKLFGRGPNNAT